MKLYLALFVLVSLSTSVFAGDSCDCDYHPRGCTISAAPPRNKACYCKYKGGWTCGGEIRPCKQPDARHCKNPDKSLPTCLQGGGDCEAYSDHCDCNYHSGGCRIVKPSPPYTACKCFYKGFWTCGAEIVSCRDANSEQCIRPDESRLSCTQGGGDCGAY